jgi:multisubunit Na+/H+ antiporter MnhG subunit
MIEQQSIKRPIGMTILLVLSFINACLQIFSSLGMYVTAPIMSEMMANGEMEETMRPLLAAFSTNQSAIDETLSLMETRLSVNRIYYLITAVLYVGSLIGVIKMFKLQRSGFHFYSISQMLILIATVAYVYSKEGQNMFFNEFLTTIMFILIYHLFLKRVELQAQQNNPNGTNDYPTERE